MRFNPFSLALVLLLVVGSFGQFSVHFDIEPASLPEWQTNQTGVANQYLDLLDKINAVKGNLKLTMDISISYTSFSLTRNGVTKLFAYWILDKVDIAMMMFYRNTLNGPNAIFGLTQGCVDYATSIGKKAVVGLETTQQDPSYITFYGYNASYLENSLVQIKAHYSSSTGYGGVAVHDLDGYTQLVKGDNTYINDKCNPKYLFVWNYQIATSQSSISSYMSFAKQHCVTRTYLESESLLKTDTTSLRAFWSASQANGMGLDFLFGNAVWVRPAQHSYVVSLVNQAVNFVKSL